MGGDADHENCVTALFCKLSVINNFTTIKYSDLMKLSTQNIVDIWTIL